MRRLRAILIGNAATVRQMSRQLELMGDPPETIGCVLQEEDAADLPYLGRLSELEAIAERYRPGIALVSFPAVMSSLIMSTRTTLRRLGIADRFLATIEDQVAGIGPRTHLNIDPQALIGRDPHDLDETLIRTAIQGKNVLITGAGGSIGSELARQCARYQPRAVLLMERSENSLFEIDRQLARFFPDLPRRALLHDVTEAERSERIVKTLRAQVIFHAAAHKHVPMMEDHPAQAIHNNVFGTKAIVDAAVAAGAERLVMISTDKAVNAVSVMGATKRLAERYVQHISATEAGARTLLRIVRFGNVLGSACSVLPIWSRQIEEGGPITVTHPDMTRYFMTIPEAAGLVIQAASLPVGATDGPAGGEVFILDMGKPVRIHDLALRYVRMHGLVPISPGDSSSCGGSICVAISGIRPGEKLHEELAHADETTASTSHPAIRAWQGSAPERSDINVMLSELEGVCFSDNQDKVLRILGQFTPHLGSGPDTAELLETTAA